MLGLELPIKGQFTMAQSFDSALGKAKARLLSDGQPEYLIFCVLEDGEEPQFFAVVGGMRFGPCDTRQYVEELVSMHRKQENRL